MIPVGRELDLFLRRYSIDPGKVSVEIHCADERTMRLIQTAMDEEFRQMSVWSIEPPKPIPGGPSLGSTWATIFGIKFEWTYTPAQYRDPPLFPRRLTNDD